MNFIRNNLVIHRKLIIIILSIILIVGISINEIYRLFGKTEPLDKEKLKNTRYIIFIIYIILISLLMIYTNKCDIIYKTTKSLYDNDPTKANFNKKIEWLTDLIDYNEIKRAQTLLHKNTINTIM